MTDTSACPTCAADATRGGLSRRGMLAGLLGAGAVGAFGVPLPGISTRYAFADTPAAYDGDVLVVVSLRGGADGLSIVVPTGDPDYAKKRPTIGVPQAALLPGDGIFGLHPQLQPLYPLWQAGKFGAVHAVGQVDPTRSHFEALREMERAAPGATLKTGWLDRALQQRGSGTPFRATVVSGDLPSQQFAGPAPVLSMSSVDSFVLDAADGSDASWEATELARWRKALTSFYDGQAAPIAAPASTALAALKTTVALKKAGYTPGPGASYDSSSSLAMALRDVARLVKAGVGLQVAAVEFDDWDMHDDLGTLTKGRLRDKLGELAAALAAFTTDLGPALANVTIVTLSEFGRRVEENGSAGTDHGHGNVSLVIGGGVNGGKVYGAWPGLADSHLDDGDLAVTTDYRVLLAEILTKRCRQSAIAKVFPGLPSGSVGIMAARP
ncbi:MAG: DUF1501 domain-containing protein [Frankiales bacterium]|nr:DUF1501 domain-containing protein [Frankiales bacterium]